MKVGEIALQLGVTPNTIRNWCRRYAAHLSEGANPPGGGERLFTPRDLSVFTYIHVALQDGVNHPEIALQLAEKRFNDDGEDVVIGLAELMPSAATPPAKPTEARSEDLLLPVVLSSIEGRQSATDARLDTLQQALATLQQQQTERVNMLVTGIVIGGAAVLVVVALVMALGS